ncbi:unnamed protein product [Urochloa humidicola]
MCEQKKKSKGGKWRHPFSLVSRIAGMGLAVAAAAVMATASECTVYADYGGARPRTVTYADFTPFVYLVVACSVAAGMEAVAVFLAVCKKEGKKVRAALMPVLAAAAPALLYTAAGAAFAAGWDIYYYMEPSGRRYSICSSSVGRRFCNQVHVSMWLALNAAVNVSVAEWAAATSPGHHGGGGGGACSDSGSDSDSESVCGHGCHNKH